MRRIALLVLLAGCGSMGSPESEELPANRADVASALYAQLDLVISRHVVIAAEEGREAERERAELRRLADEIAVRIVRIDANADVDELVKKLERTR